MNLSIEINKNKKYDHSIVKLFNVNNINDNIINSLQDLNEINKNLAELVNNQQQKIDTIENNIIQTEIKSLKSLKNLQKTDSLFFSYKPIFIGSILGAIVGGPFGLVMGIKWIGGISTIIGGITGYKLQKN
tara:strand:+ start:3389 stop:3781 length:393 start_codon:yes stop_codon:yes gene_type:complete